MSDVSIETVKMGRLRPGDMVRFFWNYHPSLVLACKVQRKGKIFVDKQGWRRREFTETIELAVLQQVTGRVWTRVFSPEESCVFLGATVNIGHQKWADRTYGTSAAPLLPQGSTEP